MFVGIAALAYAMIVATRRPWWIKAMLALAVAPVAMLVNSLRVAATAVLHEQFSGEAAQRFSHDFAGWVMILSAAALFALVSMYLGRLFVEVESVGGEKLVRRAAGAS
jgi:exosortase/archaeosortase family protein